MYVLLRYINEYEQDGGYFAGIFETYSRAVKASPNNHIGRKGFEYEWYEVFPVIINEFHNQEEHK